MKKLALLIITFWCSMNVFGQMWDASKPDKTWLFGVRAGLNCSTVSIDDDTWNDYEANTKYLFHAGFNVDYNIVKSFAVGTGLFYSNKGFRDYWDGDFNIGYLQIPALAVYKCPVADNINIQLKGGGYFSYLVEKPETLSVAKIDMGLIIGVGISFKKLYLGAQYDFGLYEAIDQYYLEAKNRNLAISIGYDF